MNTIEEMRERLSRQFSGVAKPLEGYQITQMRPTANNMPRFPQSNIPSNRFKYESPGRPKKEEPPKIKRTWEGFL